MGTKTVFETLNAIDVSKHIESPQGQRYISWSNQWSELLKAYPTATYEVHENDIGDPFTVSIMGIMVKVSVTIEGLTRTINYPVLNSANKAMKTESYSYKVKEYVNRKPTGRMVEKYIEPATSFDINTAIMRALTKCIALHGLSLYIYNDEAMPEEQKISSSQLQEITTLCKTHGFMISDIAKQFGNYPKIADIPESKFDDFILWATPK